MTGRRGGPDLAELKRRIDQLIEQRLSEGHIKELISAGAAQGLSTREIEEDLKRRGISIDHSTVARLMKGRLLSPRDSSKSILRAAASQPRDRHGKAIADAEPESEK